MGLVATILGIIVALLTIISILVGGVIAIVKAFAKLSVILSNVNTQQVQTNERLTKIEIILNDYDSRLDSCEENNEECFHQIDLINQRCQLKEI